MKNNNTFQTDNIHFPHNKNTNYLNNRWSNQINDFQVLVIYDEEEKHFDNGLNSKNDKSKNIVNIPIFQGAIQSETFIIWQRSYKENKELFFKLRLKARDELILRIAKLIVTYLLTKYEDYTTPPRVEYPTLKEKIYIDQLIQKFDAMLKNDTFLAEYEVWDEFCKWFKKYLTDWVLQDMEGTIGLKQLEKMNGSQINESFHKCITKNLSRESQFMLSFKNIVNNYVQNWVGKITSTMDIENISLEKTTKLLELNGHPIITSTKLPRKDITITMVRQGNLVVMSNAIYQSVREALSNKKFEKLDGEIWPTAVINKGSNKGVVQLRPPESTGNNELKNQIKMQQAWDQVKSLSELDVDVLDALCSFYLSNSKHHKDMVEIHFNDLLSIRGLKPKLGGDGRRGGYEKKQKTQVLKALTRIQSLWIDIEKAIVYRKGRPVVKMLQGRAFVFKDKNNNDYISDEQFVEKKFLFKVDEVFAQFLYGSGRQVALLPIQALQYNPYHEIWEKKITRYLSWRWRTQARRGDYLQPHKISTLLNVIGEKINERMPSRTRERMEKALDHLLEDEVIGSWQYENWDESIASNNGWVRIWGNSTIIIDPPEIIREHYNPIERKRKDQKNIDINQGNSNTHNSLNNIGEKIKNLRKNLGLTLLQAAEEMEISASYLSIIERGEKVPSAKIKKRLEFWVEIYE